MLRPHPTLAGGPVVGVVMPTYKHPVLLAEALLSLLAQAADFTFVVAVVIDGCPMQETLDVLAALGSGSDNLHLLYTRNGGPSAARNIGIDFLLSLYPDLQGIFFLDSDNRLQRRALQICFDALVSAPPETGWIYSDIDSFGISWAGNYGVPYSRLLHVAHGNFCDTGSFVARRVFDAGVRFDEDKRSGYEDWDFWLQCVAKGFVGRAARFGLSYRQRPESRNKENHRSEGAIRARLLERHKGINSFAKLSRWEHDDHPRFALVADGLGGVALFTDPQRRERVTPLERFAESFWSHLRLPDHHDLPPYLVAGNRGALGVLEDAGLLHNAFYLLMRAAEGANFAVLVIESSRDAFAAAVGPVADVAEAQGAALWAATSRIVKEVCLDPADGWLKSLATPHPGPTIRKVTLRIPGAGDTRTPDVLARFLDSLDALRASPHRTTAPALRWESRGAILPSRDTYYRVLCKFLDVEDLVCRLRGENRREIGFVLPIGAYGGAEKVVYALAQVLRRRGMRTHMFMLGRPVQKDVSAFRDSFDTRNFLDADYPVWGGGLSSGGQEFFRPDDPALKRETVGGLLMGLDLIVNCSSAPLNSIVGGLRQQGVKVATYLHVTDRTPLGRLVGHPLLAVAFEHCYDVILTCSDGLRYDLHALGIPGEKIMAIRNTAAFALDPAARDAAERHRSEPRGARPLRLLYMGRLDRQKGVDRLVGVLGELRRRHAPVEVRVVGSALLDGGDDWGTALAGLGIVPEPPVYASEGLIEAYGWADVLLLPSRWEGAPLVVPECQSLGCIPIATAVGAVDELIEDGKDGLLVAHGGDRQIVDDVVSRIEAILADDDWRRELALTGLDNLRRASWEENFAPVVDWIEREVRAGVGTAA